MTIRWNEHGEIHARVETVQPPHAFSYRWRPFPWAKTATDELTESNSTLVEFSLRADGDRTILRVVESGFAGLDCTESQRAEQFRGNTEGWAMELGELADHAQRAAA